MQVTTGLLMMVAIMLMFTTTTTFAFSFSGNYCVNLIGAGIIAGPTDSSLTKLNVTVWTIDTSYNCVIPMTFDKKTGNITLHVPPTYRCFQGNGISNFASFNWLLDALHWGKWYLTKPICLLDQTKNFLVTGKNKNGDEGRSPVTLN
eukprot:TRINITY_DN4305_c0_g1_i1.p1 TRINITY_DN4305_c0_g1~~TRINITY_DN4305_c0_g1_i1.p1  ORF type:complete len:161 (-),score=39.21 TRINITY_DN4305_c0_g1_i1:47-487(-)